MPVPFPPAYMLTAPGREEILAGTLARWSAAGGGEGPVIHSDPTPRGAHGLTRVMGGWRSLLERALADTEAAVSQYATLHSQHILLLEDDLEFAPGFRERVAAWGPLVDGRVRAFASFFNPGVPVAAGVPAEVTGDDWFIAAPDGVLGSQALLVARDFARGVLECWGTLDGFAVMKMGRMAAQGNLRVYYHRPSLVEHVGTVSAWGGYLRRSVDFQGSVSTL